MFGNSIFKWSHALLKLEIRKYVLNLALNVLLARPFLYYCVKTSCWFLCRNSIEKNQLVWVGLTVSGMFLILEVPLLRGKLWFIGKGLYLDTALSSLF